ncbi:MAG: YHS domain-containing protein [Desulfurococcaceae archaeon]
MRVGPSNSKYKTIYKGKVYYFCSLHCLGEFEKTQSSTCMKDVGDAC